MRASAVPAARGRRPADRSFNSDPLFVQLDRNRRHPECANLFGENFPCTLRNASRNHCQLRVGRADALVHECRRVNCSRVVLNFERTWATLKRPHTWSGTVHANNTLAACQQFAARGRAARSCDVTLARQWDSAGCNDYTQGAVWGWRTDLHPLARLQPELVTSLSLPPLAVVTYASRAGKGVARLVESAARMEVPLKFLGWEPGSPQRWHEWYLGSKMVTLLLFARRLPPNALLVVTDGTDILYQRNVTALHQAAHAVLAHAGADVVFGAEAYCYHCSRTGDAERLRKNTLFRFLNGGCMAARAAPLVQMLQAYLDEMGRDGKLRGTPEADAARAHALRSAYADGTPRVYHSTQQALLTRLLLEQQSRRAGTKSFPTIALDHNATLCLNLFSSTPRKHMEWTARGTIRYQAAGTEAPIVHYNGNIADSDVDWLQGFTADVLMGRLRGRHPKSSVTPVAISPSFELTNMDMERHRSNGTAEARRRRRAATTRQRRAALGGAIAANGEKRRRGGPERGQALAHMEVAVNEVDAKENAAAQLVQALQALQAQMQEMREDNKAVRARMEEEGKSLRARIAEIERQPQRKAVARPLRRSPS